MDITIEHKLELMKLALTLALENRRTSGVTSPASPEAVIAIYRQLLVGLTAQ
ncbi:MAG: hypothetical protein MZV65_39695 [Chromatiales bacterium]|nr:hypothetical protein [Chromatiales bacterium]MCK7581160.1 hypothetical protein [Chromatiales bacterium]